MKYIFDLSVATTLVVFIIVRLVTSDDQWMVTIQYLALIIAYGTLARNMLFAAKKKASFKAVLKTIILGMFICIIVSVLGSIGLVDILACHKTMDIITLIILFLSLPQDLYLKLLERNSQ